MRELDTKLIEEAVAQLCVQANVELTPDIEASLKEAEGRESCPLGRSILGKLRENLEFARQTGIPVCQDTGMAVVFAELGQEVVLRGMPFEECRPASAEAIWRAACAARWWRTRCAERTRGTIRPPFCTPASSRGTRCA